MAAGDYIIPLKAKLNLVNATNMLANTSNWKLALILSSWTPADSTDELWADVSAHEIAAGNGYTAGGASLTGVSLSIVGSNVVFTHSAVTWTASGGYIPAWRRGVIYYNGTLNSKVKPLLAHFLANDAPADASATPDTKLLTVNPPTNGVIRL
jgi:hypothetical protein